jgi:hypothetical protein
MILVLLQPYLLGFYCPTWESLVRVSPPQRLILLILTMEIGQKTLEWWVLR